MLCAFFQKAKAACFHSLTVAWSYLLGLASVAMQRIDDLAGLVGDAAFSKQVESLVGADPKVIGKWLSIVAAITIASRLRGVIAAKKAS